MIPSSFPFARGLYRASIISTLGDWVLTDALYLEISGHLWEPTTWMLHYLKDQQPGNENCYNESDQLRCWKDHGWITAAIDGISDRPGDPWETSIPKIKVGVSFIRGMCEGCSIANKEFIPPSYKRGGKNNISRNYMY